MRRARLRSPQRAVIGTDGSPYVSIDARLQIGIAHCSRVVMLHSFNVPTRYFIGLQRFMACSPQFCRMPLAFGLAKEGRRIA